MGRSAPFDLPNLTTELEALRAAAVAAKAKAKAKPPPPTLNAKPPPPRRQKSPRPPMPTRPIPPSGHLHSIAEEPAGEPAAAVAAARAPPSSSIDNAAAAVAAPAPRSSGTSMQSQLWQRQSELAMRPPPMCGIHFPGSDMDEVRCGPLGVAWFKHLQQSPNYPSEKSSRHNVALKWLRQVGEQLHVEYLTLDATSMVLVPEIQHHKGPDYSFEGEPKHKWHWTEMVAQLQDADMVWAVEGPKGDRKGICGCELIRTGSYDHMRHHKKEPTAVAGELHKFWDFALYGDDGSAVYLHPDFKTLRVLAYYRSQQGDEPEDTEVPPNGPGGTWGRGCFRHYRDKRQEKTLRFKPPHMIERRATEEASKSGGTGGTTGRSCGSNS